MTSLARPGGNVTGLSYVGMEVTGKQVELLREAVTGLEVIAVLANPANPSHKPRTQEVVTAARGLRLHVEIVEARSREDVADSIGVMVKRGAGTGVVLGDVLFVSEAPHSSGSRPSIGFPSCMACGRRPWLAA